MKSTVALLLCLSLAPLALAADPPPTAAPPAPKLLDPTPPPPPPHALTAFPPPPPPHALRPAARPPARPPARPARRTRPSPSADHRPAQDRPPRLLRGRRADGAPNPHRRCRHRGRRRSDRPRRLPARLGRARVPR